MTTPLASLILRLGAEGCTVEQIAAAVEHQEQEILARERRRREVNAARQARWRGKPAAVGVTRRNETQRDVTAIGEFDLFWAEYPLKVARKAAERAFRAARSKAEFDAIMGGLKLYKAGKPAAIAWAHAASWLNGERWKDEVQNGSGTGAHRTNSASGGRETGTDAVLAGVVAASERRARERGQGPVPPYPEAPNFLDLRTPGAGRG